MISKGFKLYHLIITWGSKLYNRNVRLAPFRCHYIWIRSFSNVLKSCYLSKNFPQLNYVLIKLWNFRLFGKFYFKVQMKM